ncbi:MAG: tRNA (mo5U34)-methyltransferase [Solirubrobacterales bacterium]|jgi:tRNA (mo5U34)-methyltransferase|nr:tRNA (mo5U34)-methyltransferase [Solirubrobacterales bacterium]
MIVPETPTKCGDGNDARTAVAAHPYWYHTIEVAPGVVTPGWFDLRGTVGDLPWPDVEGKRCLDVGTADGFFAFELERRGASEVVAADLADHTQWDWPSHLRDRGVEFLRWIAGPRKGVGLRLAIELRGSAVVPIERSAYELAPDDLGHFDVITCGSLLLHLRDPIRALEAIRSVCAEKLLVTNQIERSPLLSRRRPVARLDGASDLCQWWLPNIKGHEQMVRAAGFEIDISSGAYAVGFGSSHPPSRSPVRYRVLKRAIGGGEGVPHHAILARPSS